MSQNNSKNKPEKASTGKSGRMAKLLGLPFRVLADFCSVLFALAIIWLFAIVWLMNRPSVNLEFVKPHYENWFANAFAGHSSTIEGYSARWVADKGLIEIHAKNIEIKSKANNTQSDKTIQHISDVRGYFRIQPEMVAPKLVSLSIKGGAMTLKRDKNKQFHIFMGEPNYMGQGGINTVGSLWIFEKNGEGVTQKIERIEIENANLYIIDETNNQKINLKKLDGAYLSSGEKIKIVMSANAVGDNDKHAHFDLIVKTDNSLNQFDINLSTKGINPNMAFGNALQKTNKWQFLSNINAPVDIDLDFGFSKSKGIDGLKFEINTGLGKIKTSQGDKQINSSELLAQYNPETKNIDILKFKLDSEVLSLRAKSVIKLSDKLFSDFLDNSFEIDLEELNWSGFGYLQEPINIKSAHIKASIQNMDGIQSAVAELKKKEYAASPKNEPYIFSNTKKLVLHNLEMDMGNYQPSLNGEIVFGKEGVGKIKLGGKVGGVISKNQLMAIWPKNISPNARLWVNERVKKANIKNGRFRLNLDKSDFFGRIANDNIDLGFDIDNADILYVKTMPVMKGIKGRGHIRGDMAKFDIFSASNAGVIIRSGQVLLPSLFDKKQRMSIHINASGKISDMLKLINHKPLGLADKNNLIPDQIQGNGSINFSMTRPLAKIKSNSEIKYSVNGRLLDVAVMGKAKISNGQLDLDLADNVVNISGPVNIAGWDSKLDWQKTLGAGAPPARYTLSGTIGRDFFDRFGLGLRRYFGGKIAVLIEGSGGWNFDKNGFNAKITADFSDIDANLGKFWAKPKGVSGELNADISFIGNGAININNVSLSSKGLEIAGNISLANDYKLLGLKLDRLKIDNFIDAKLQAIPDNSGNLIINLDGNYLDIRHWVKKAFASKPENNTIIALPVKLDGGVDNLVLADNYQLKSANMKFHHTGDFVELININGKIDGGDFKVSLDDKQTGIMRDVKILLPNAGNALKAFFGIANVKNGTININAKLPPSGQKGAFYGQLDGSDFVLVRAPAFAKILSLASLSGLAERLSGSGLSFTSLDMQFSWQDGVLKVRKARAAGPALGLTGAGDINIAAKTVDFDGVLVPSYTVNSILGDVPVLGDIIVGKKGEGMFAVNYTVKGRFSKTQISINPLSALTPGFLRRIFDVKRDKISDPELKELIKQQRKDKNK